MCVGTINPTVVEMGCLGLKKERTSWFIGYGPSPFNWLNPDCAPFNLFLYTGWLLVKSFCTFILFCALSFVYYDRKGSFQVSDYSNNCVNVLQLVQWHGGSTSRKGSVEAVGIDTGTQPVSSSGDVASSESSTDATSAQCTKEVLQADEQKRDLAFAYILTSVDASCRAMVRRVRCPREASRLWLDTFKFVSEASIDAKLTCLQAISMQKDEHVVEYSSSIVGLVSELQDAEHDVSEV